MPCEARASGARARRDHLAGRQLLKNRLQHDDDLRQSSRHPIDIRFVKGLQRDRFVDLGQPLSHISLQSSHPARLDLEEMPQEALKQPRVHRRIAALEMKANL